MPNHVRNIVKIKKIKPDDLDEVLNKITSISDEGVFPIDCQIDFDKIIPEPKSEAECPDEYKMNKDSHVELFKDKEWFDWYKWRCKYWGTKWNAYDTYSIIKPTQVVFVFSTAWSAPYPIYEQLMSLGYPLEIRYADENLGSNCGKIIYDECEHYAEHLTPEDRTLPNPRDFAKRVWEY